MEQANAPAAPNRLNLVPTQLRAEVCSRTVTLQELLIWTPGTIIPFAQSASSLLTLHLGRVQIGRGTAVKIGEQAGIRMTVVRPSRK